LVGDIIELSIRTRGENKGLKIKLEAPPAGGVFNTSILEGNNPFAGAEVALLTPFLANEMKIPSNIKGIAILKIERGALAGRYGFRAGDIITSVSNRELESVAQLEEILSAGASFWRLEIIRNGQRIRQVLR
jgi:S1-C subfamily serine protease